MIRCTCVNMAQCICCAAQHTNSPGGVADVLGAGKWPTLDVTHAAGASFQSQVGAQDPPRLLVVFVFLAAIDIAALAANGGTITRDILMHNAPVHTPQEVARLGNKLSNSYASNADASHAVHYTHNARQTH